MSSDEIKLSSNQIFACENNVDIFKTFDGNARTKYVGGQFPGYVDIDLERNCKVTKIVFECPKRGYSIFSVYKSLDSVNFSLALEQTSEADMKGHYEFDCNFDCRVVRIFVKYNSFSPYVEIKTIRLFGQKLGTEIITAKEDFPVDFNKSEYNVSLTKQDTVDELHSLVERTIGKQYRDGFIFEIENSDKEFFRVCDYNGKVKITANSGVNAAAGLNQYYKKRCNVHISQVGNNIALPNGLPCVGEEIYRQTPFSVRYSYNYCTLSYTMAFWDEADWQKELDWLSLNGVNVVLDITAQEEVWRRFLLKLGYNMNSIKSFVTGPAYYAWFCMANIYGIGGPIHDGFFKKRTELARKNHLYMRKMGMMPVMQGYNGMVPADIKKYVPSARVIPQGLWNGLPRPYMLKTDSESYSVLAEIFYECQNSVFGNISNYYATDPFHEGGKSGNMKVERVSKCILDAMLKNNPNSVWIIQSWGENPSKELVDGLADRKNHALILDLYAEKKPRWKSYLGKEFLGTPWVYCMLNNFGGRMGLHGHLSTIATEVSSAAKQAQFMKGIGITPEATHSNPIVFDLFFDTMWGKGEYPDEIDLKQWLKAYAKRRYGECTENIYKALLTFNDTVYNPALNENGEGAPESVINARPAAHITSPSTWGNGVVAYDKKVFANAVRLFAGEGKNLLNSPGYRFDLIDLVKQVTSNTAQDYQKNMEKALKSRDLIEFMKWSDKFLKIIKSTDKILSMEPEFMLGSWLSKAKALANGFDEFTADMFEFNARAQITTWSGSRNAADLGGLKDYSNKQWSGLTFDFYFMRWKLWIDNQISALSGKASTEIDFFKIENKWTWQKNEYTTTPTEIDLDELMDCIK